eukprot:4357255-Alexandrium_andersonii.AAC.1
MPGEWRAHLGPMRPHPAPAAAREARASVWIPARAGLARTVLAGSSSQRGAGTHMRCNATRALTARYCPRQLSP